MDLQSIVDSMFDDESPNFGNGATRGNSFEPVHVFYGGADLFDRDTPSKLGNIAVRLLETYAPDPAAFSGAFWLEGSDAFPYQQEAADELERLVDADPEHAMLERPDVMFSHEVFNKTKDKLIVAPIEDLRIDFEDGYGFRTNEEEDSHAIESAKAVAELTRGAAVGDSHHRAPLFGIRIKSLGPHTRKRAARTLELFFSELMEASNGRTPDGFVVALPKIVHQSEVTALSRMLSQIEYEAGAQSSPIGIELMIETPESLFLLKELVEASEGRCTSAHFGAYDLTSSLGITSNHQHIRHEACNFARNLMLATLAKSGIRLCDSVTTEIPVPVHKGEGVTDVQRKENFRAVHRAWRLHFNNIRHSMINGFYQSWDLHPAQLVARYASVYAFYLESGNDQMQRLRGFIDKASRANLTGNVFDDTASAQGILNFFVRGIGCRAFDRESVAADSGLSLEEIECGSFQEIMVKRADKH